MDSSENGRIKLQHYRPIYIYHLRVKQGNRSTEYSTRATYTGIPEEATETNIRILIPEHS